MKEPTVQYNGGPILPMSQADNWSLQRIAANDRDHYRPNPGIDGECDFAFDHLYAARLLRERGVL